MPAKKKTAAAEPVEAEQPAEPVTEPAPLVEAEQPAGNRTVRREFTAPNKTVRRS